MSGLLGSTSLTPQPGIIAFTEIPNNWKVPGNYMEVKAAISANAVLAFPAYGLIMGQMYTTGSNAGQATPGTAYAIYSGQQANTLFGEGSILAEQCWSWIANNPYTPVDAIGIADATGATAATGSVTFAGAATAAGTLALYFGGVRVPVAVNLGDTAAIVSANLATAFNLQTEPGYRPVPLLKSAYAGGSAVVVTFTAQNKGTLGNQVDIRLNAQIGDVTPPGLTVTIAGMSGGATDPAATISSTLSGLSKWYTDVAFAWTDSTNTATLTAWLNERYGAMVKLDAHAYVGTDASYGTALTYLPNCKYLSALPMQNPLSPSWKYGAAMAGACCYSSAQQPALQMTGVPLKGIVAPAVADQFTPAEQQILLLGGLSTYTVDATGTVYLQRVATTFQTDPSGVPDSSWFDLKDAKVPTRVRYDWDNYMSLLYPRSLLCADGTLAAEYAPNAVTPNTLKGSWTSRSAVYEQNGWIQNSAVTAANSTFVIDANDGNRVDARQQIQVMGNLYVLAGSLEFISNN